MRMKPGWKPIPESLGHIGWASHLWAKRLGINGEIEPGLHNGRITYFFNSKDPRNIDYAKRSADDR